jgi:AraC family transcriptional regulator, arabinose operon regulatory protein
MFPKTLDNRFFEIRSINKAPMIHRCEASWHWKPQALRDYDLWYVLDGIGKLRVNQKTHAVGRGSAFLLPPKAEIEGTQDPHHRLVVFAVHFDLKILSSKLLRLPIQVPWVVRDQDFMSTLAHRVVATASRNDFFWGARIATLIELMLHQLQHEITQRRTKIVDTKIEELIQMIRKDPGLDWNMELMAKHCHLSRSQVTRRFQKTTGLSPTHFLIQTRIDRATRLIQETDLSLSQIADALSYRDLFYFSRQFKEMTGKTPSSLRIHKPKRNRD